MSQTLRDLQQKIAEHLGNYPNCLKQANGNSFVAAALQLKELSGKQVTLEMMKI